MKDTKKYIKLILILILTAGILLSIAGIINSSLTLAKVAEPIQDYDYTSTGSYVVYTYPTAEELLFPILYLILSSFILVLTVITLLFVIISKQDLKLKYLILLNIILLIIINIMLAIINPILQYYSALYSLVGLNPLSITIPLLLNISPLLLIIFNTQNKKNIESSYIVETELNTQTTNEESLMQEEITKLKHQLKLKKLEEEYLDLKKQLEPKSKAKKESD